MKKYIVFLFAFCVGCANYILPTAKELQQEGIVTNEEERLSITRARMNLTGACLDCHRVVYPQELSSQGWKRVLPSMIKKSRLGQQAMDDIYFYIDKTMECVELRRQKELEKQKMQEQQ